MIPISAERIAQWRAELDLAVEFRDKEFGTYQQPQPGAQPTSTLAGKNLEYFEQGARTDVHGPPLNIVFAIVKNVVPTQFFQNPRVQALPEFRSDTAGEDAFYVSELLNRDLRDPLLRIKDTGQLTTFDGYVLAVGVVKVGYATEFGQDILPTKGEEKQHFKERVKAQIRGVMEGMGLVQPKPPEPEQVQVEEYIRSESPYIQWVSPFDFVIDPTARDLTSARWCGQLIRRTLADVKRDRRYSRAKHELVAEAVDDARVTQSMVEEFQTVDVWEIHYKDADAPTGIRLLTLGANQTQTKALAHENNEYDIGGWQFEWLVQNKHGHRLYPISTISVIRPLIDRLNKSFAAILEQVDKFQAKLVCNDKVSSDGLKALKSNVLGAVVKVDGDTDVRDAVAVISMQQVAADMLGFVNQVVDFIILITGLTRAQLTGLTTAQTATEAQIGQSGQNLRRTDEANVVSAWFTRVLTKYWRVKAQLQDLTEVDLVKETGLPDPQTGMMQTQWYPPIDETRAKRLKTSRFRFELEVSSMQKPNLEIIRAQFEQFMRALMEPVVTNGLALDGKRVSAQEAVRQWSRFFEEYGLQGLSKLVVPITDPMQRQALLGYGQEPTETGGNGAANRLTGSVPNQADLISAVAGEKGMGVPGA